MKKFPCPKCGTDDQGVKYLDDGIQYFKCFACGFVCRMKDFRSKFKKPLVDKSI